MTKTSVETLGTPDESPLSIAKENLHTIEQNTDIQSEATSQLLEMQAEIDTEDKANQLGKSLLDARDRRISRRIQNGILSEENFDRLDELAGGLTTSSAELTAGIRELQNAVEHMNEPWKPGKLLGVLNGNYAVSQDRLYKLREMVPKVFRDSPDTFSGPQKQYYEFYLWMIDELQRTVPGEKEIYTNLREQRNNLPASEMHLREGMKGLAIAGIGLITAAFGIARLSKGEFPTESAIGAGILAYITNPKLFQSMPGRMNDKLEGLTNTTFDKYISSMPEELASDIYDTDTASMRECMEHLKTLTIDKPIEESDIEMLGLNAKAESFLIGKPAEDAYVILDVLNKQRGTDDASVEVQEITLNAIKKKADTRQLTQNIRKAVQNKDFEKLS